MKRKFIRFVCKCDPNGVEQTDIYDIMTDDIIAIHVVKTKVTSSVNNSYSNHVSIFTSKLKLCITFKETTELHVSKMEEYITSNDTQSTLCFNEHMIHSIIPLAI